jgi:O-antigen/teichoic acid export membrane protein
MVRKLLQLLFGMGTYSAGQWLMLSVLAHLGGPAEVGKFSLGMALAGPLAVLFSLSSRTLLQTEVSRTGFLFRHYWHLRLITNALMLLVLVAIILWRDDPADVAWVIFWVGVYKAVEYLSDMTYGLAQVNDHHHIMGYSLFLRGILGFVAFAAVYVCGGGLVAALIAATACWAAIFYLHDWNRTTRWHGGLKPYEFEPMARIAWRSLPVAIAVFISGFNIVIPRLVLEEHAGLAALGIFSSLSYALTLGNLAVNALANTVLTKLSERWDRRNIAKFNMLILQSLGIMLGLCVAGILLALVAGRYILLVLYGPAFADYGDLLVLMAVAASLTMVGTFVGFALLSTKMFRLQLALNAAIVALMGIFCLVVIPRSGLWGAAWSLVVLGVLRIAASAVNYVAAIRSARKETHARA